MSEIKAFDGAKVLLTDERWRHIVIRHPELENKIIKIRETISNPDEAYADSTGAIHVLKKLVHEVSDYIVVIYRKEDEKGYIRTAYYINFRRKERRYREFRRLKPS